MVGTDQHEESPAVRKARARMLAKNEEAHRSVTDAAREGRITWYAAVQMLRQEYRRNHKEIKGKTND